MMGTQYFERGYYESFAQQLEQDYTSIRSLHSEIAEYTKPRRFRDQVTDVNRGDRRSSKILDSTATKAGRNAAAGMVTGITSPARPWFSLAPSLPELKDIPRVKEYVAKTTSLISDTFLRSNLYTVLPSLYEDVLFFGTSVISIEPHPEKTVFFRHHPVGSYRISVDSYGRANGFSRQFTMTVQQVVDTFAEVKPDGKIDFLNLSDTVKNLFEVGNKNERVRITQVICPNPNYRPGSQNIAHRRFISCYYEEGVTMTSGQAVTFAPHTGGKVLSEKGFKRFPVFAARWSVIGDDTYCVECPGVEALGDIKGLQLLHRKKFKALDRMIDPTMVAPSDMKNQKKNGLGFLPGGVIFENPTSSGKIRAAYEINPRLQELLMDIDDHRARIRSMFYEDLFLMLQNTDRREITAREIDARYEEKLLALGPVLERLNTDLLDPLIDLTFDIHAEAGLLPPPPPELEGDNLKIEYVSIMAQAQKLVGISSIERFLMTSANLAQSSQDVALKVDYAKAVDVLAERMSIPFGIVRDQKTVDDLKAKIQAQAAKQAQLEQMQAAQMQANTMRTLSETKVNDDTSALAAMMQGRV